jgi:hydroxyacylglutathione hydrolase
VGPVDQYAFVPPSPIGDKLCSTIGYEFSHNNLLRQPTEAKFRELALKNLPPKPGYYPRLKERNTSSPASTAGRTVVPALPPGEFKAALADTTNLLVDTRHMLAFGGGHIPGALNIGRGGPAIHPGGLDAGPGEAPPSGP